MKKSWLFLIFITSLMGCQMRYGYIPRVYKWNKTENAQKPVQKNRQAIHVNNRLPVLDAPIPPGTWPQELLNTPSAQSSSLHHPVTSVFAVDSPFTLTGDTAYRESPEERQARIKRNVGKGAFITTIIGLNLAVVTGQGIVGLVLFGIAAILILITALTSYLLSHNRRDDVVPFKQLTNRFEQILVTGALFIVAALLLLLLAFVFWSEILAALALATGAIGIIMVLYGAVASFAFGTRNADYPDTNRFPSPLARFAYTFLITSVAIIALALLFILFLFLTF